VRSNTLIIHLFIRHIFTLDKTNMYLKPLRMHFVEGYGRLNFLQNALDVLHVLDAFFAFFKALKYDAMWLDASDDLDGEIDLVGQAEEQVMPTGGFAQLDEMDAFPRVGIGENPVDGAASLALGNFIPMMDVDTDEIGFLPIRMGVIYTVQLYA